MTATLWHKKITFKGGFMTLEELIVKFEDLAYDEEVSFEEIALSAEEQDLFSINI